MSIVTIICKNDTCKNDGCPYNRYAVPIDGKQVLLQDLIGTEDCQYCTKTAEVQSDEVDM